MGTNMLRKTLCGSLLLPILNLNAGDAVKAPLTDLPGAPMQSIRCDNQAVEDAYKLALLVIKTNTHDGVLAAGADYGAEWTRDTAINSWNGVSLLRPEVAERSLWRVTDDKALVQHQYWDKIIWTIAAYNHYKASGDLAFLQQAYSYAVNTMAELEGKAFDREYGLFMGPSVFNDGIAGYPEPVYEPSNHSSGVLAHKGHAFIKCLSTNCIYYGSYLALARMGYILHKNMSEIILYQKKAETLKRKILAHLYNKVDNSFYYLIDQFGKVDDSQEGLGISFAVIFGLLEPEKASQIVKNTKVSKFGITSIYPDFPRYSPEKPGRHNNILWPMVNGFFAQAAIATGNHKAFTFEFNGLTQLALDKDKGDHDFREIYNPYSGRPDGGYQDAGADQRDFHWESCRSQTWSATAYVNMVLNGLVGLKLQNNRLLISPFLPDNIHYLELNGIHYRKSQLNIIIKGNGSKIESFSVNGKKRLSHAIDSTIHGLNKIVIELK